MRAAAPASASASTAGPIDLSLGDRCVLCVGGLTGARNHYRAEIETRAGRFLHHDGGREDNLHRLTPMLAAADIVICASGNISHNAYHLVKSTCKKLGKPCVLVKGTGIASFLDGLGHLAASEAPQEGRSARGDRVLRGKR
ncbi:MULTISPECIES: DUF2325 domain-containing protein [Herbaspirillum]|uniref:DUF2325 domain-containing protein n=1 Tax=Herbaspirillum TaxID=963 RepID=UPI000C0A3349|nr:MULTISPECIES: DUF2325 domain-containing protein [Herbaspirillum]MAF02785.1 DUF2325 domain-containing protein [Herbaspirillum sp.]MBN9355125.1 DUF2325 domain-containing protein [Herbaspirillum huttiense]MBO15727.1 DUF2325 domain-containing protein [Herbaspirillum sp.]|tara:strand:- start:12950 stop:13372 length:423 start_codon:yes stop_codon:yes gene_type:complete